MQGNKPKEFYQTFNAQVTAPPQTSRHSQTKNRPPRRRKRLRSWLIIFALLLILIILFPFVVVQLITTTNQGRMYDSVQQIPSRPVAMVFGAGLNRDGSPSWVLSDRLDGAIALYKAGKVNQLLMTGDQVGNTEVNSMRNYAIKHGVPASAIMGDNAGLRTYDSCYRAANNFGVTSAILVTQAYHLPRALYLCSSLGIDVVGLKAGINSNYPDQAKFDTREFAAVFVAWLDINIIHPKLGEWK
jgi:vancomycin permeability regulator SanA